MPFLQDFEGVKNMQYFQTDDEPAVAMSTDAQLQEASGVNNYALSAQEMSTIYSLHSVLFTNLVSSNWYRSSVVQLPKPSYLKPVLLRYPVLSSVVKQTSAVLGTVLLVTDHIFIFST